MQTIFLKKTRNSLLTLAIAGILGVGAYLYWSWQRALDPGPDTYLVEPGTSLRAFARQLSAHGLFAEPHSFVWLAYLTGHSRNLKAGEYRFRKGITPAELLDQVIKGRVVEYPFTLIEGWTFRQVRQALAQTPYLTQTLSGASPEQIMMQLGQPGAHPEGRFYPDTYYFSRGHTDLAMLRRANDKMTRRLEREWENRAPGLPLRSAYEALVLASIVERETGQAGERPLIAGVFINRLRLGMRLQSDPTVIYGMGDGFNGNIRLKDLRADTPYNSYTRGGLPPTPIAMPGGAAIAAVLHPADTRALYFVARGDGSHYFSDTLPEHNDAVIKYQLGGKPRRFSSNPAPR